MTITREQVADLRPGDVVEVSFIEDTYPDIVRILRGPLTESSAGYLYLGRMTVRGVDGEPWGANVRTLTVISRAPRPLYVNHDRKKPLAGDVVRDADSASDPRTWVHNAEGFSYEWMTGRTHAYVPRENLPARLRLLVDGETGRVVP